MQSSRKNGRRTASYSTDTKLLKPEKNLLQGAVKDAKQSQLQKFELKTGSVSYDPTSGAITLQKTNGEEAASMQVTAGSKGACIREEHGCDGRRYRRGNRLYQTV